MTKRIFRSIFAAALSVLLLSLLFVAGFLFDYFGDVQTRQLRAELELAAKGVEQAGRPYLEALEAGDYRVTWCAADGEVLFDTQAAVFGMENHGDREEIRQALETGRGSAARYSSTLLQQTAYEALLLPDGTVLRLSASRTTAAGLLLGLLQPLLAILILAAALSAFLANRMAKRVVEPLNRLDLDHPLENDVYEELSPLLRRVGEQHQEIDAQKRELQDRQSEFSAITRSMEEGLILLDRERRILSVNPSAMRFFSTDEGCVGQDLLTVERNRAMRKALSLAEQSGKGEARMERNGREYQLNFSRTREEDQAAGMVLLIFDVTDKVFAERNRREFTANVSHELKTPLHAIMAHAELLESGLVKPEDTPRFAGNIRREAARLVTLIGDIIRLSQLDEGGPFPLEETDLYALAREEREALAVQAAEKGVSLTLEGEALVLSGPRQLYREILHNLCDNAVKYNVKGGSVSVTVQPRGDGGVLTVSDTGVGIPPEDLDRVFERFYRVDKSRSKETGGTGLGLSIVKHAAQDLGAEVSLESELGKGTTVRVRFQKSS